MLVIMKEIQTESKIKIKYYTTLLLLVFIHAFDPTCCIIHSTTDTILSYHMLYHTQYNVHDTIVSHAVSYTVQHTRYYLTTLFRLRYWVV